MENEITWYEITKDIIIPALSILTTLVIGIIIAIILKKRDEKVKRRETLIDTYMDYLNRRIKKFFYDNSVFIFQFYTDLNINSDEYFQDHKNHAVAIELAKKKANRLQKKLQNFDKTEMNWTFFTYKFNFLLGTETYKEEVQALEDEIRENLESDVAKKDFFSSLKSELLENNEIMKNINSNDIDKIKHGFELLESFLTAKYNEHQIYYFRDYDNTLAALIGRY